MFFSIKQFLQEFFVSEKQILILVAFVFLSLTSFSQYKDFRFENYTIENGLSNNMVHCALQDHQGWMWFGTNQGICRFDGYKFTIFRNDPQDDHGLQNDPVRAIYEDHKNNLWIGTEYGGLHVLDREKNNFVRYARRKGGELLPNHNITSIIEDKRGNLWLGTEGGLSKIDSSGAVTSFVHSPGNSKSLSDNLVRILYVGEDGRLWIGTASGLDCFESSSNTFNHYRVPEKNPADNEICEIIKGSDGKFWIGTYTGGAFLFDPVTKAFESVRIDPSNSRGQTVRTIYNDHSGSYWIGTRGGIYIYSANSKKYNHVVHDDRNPDGLCHNSVLKILEDAKGDVWICTRGGVSHLIREKQVFSHYKAMPGDHSFLNNREVYAFWISPEKELWIGTENGGVNILNLKTGIYTYLTRENGLSNNCVKTFFDDGNGNLWIGTYMEGISIYNLHTKKFTYLKHSPDSASLCDNRVWSIFRDHQKNIWIGTEKGIDKLDPSGKIHHFSSVLTDKQVYWIAEDPMHYVWVGAREMVYVFKDDPRHCVKFEERTRGFFVDSKDRIWLATQGHGLALYDRQKGAVRYFDEKAGLANDVTYSILEDNAGYLWVSTTNGLSRLNPGNWKIKNFGKEEGLQSNQFNYGSAIKTPSGELLFGGINGFNMFNPAEVKENQYIPPVVFTDFRIFNQSVAISDKKDAVLRKSINETQRLIIPYNQKVLTFEFAALNYAQSSKNKYAYILEGFDKSMNKAGSRRSVTYTNLYPGEYTLRVIASNNDDKWNTNGVRLEIKILPPWWRTWWLKSLVFLLLIGLMFLLVNFFSARARLKSELYFERERAQKLHEVDMLKLKFFTNISHEIRTPLTLIIGPIEKMLQGSLSSEMAREYLTVMRRNANQLLKLINQLLDFRKLESGNLKLELSKGDIVGFIKGVAKSFEDLAVDKGIVLKVYAVKGEIFTWFDPDKIEKIMNNLLSNALKFTGKDGQITVTISLVVDGADEEGGVSQDGERKFIEIVVKDNGIGIKEANHEKIFLRFFQEQQTKDQSGTGIGLALTKELVKLHKGQIFVSSKPGKGTRFTVRLPYELESPEPVSIEPDSSSGSNAPEISPAVVLPSTRILLIIEDNADVRFFIRSHFETDFRVVEANDGKEGWKLILNTIPDIIISDIMMPGSDGLELCRKIKKDERTSHIPVILLTALSSREHKMSGLDAGADDYITKPFDLTLMRAKMENLLDLRKSLREKYTHELVLKPKNITITSPDERFLQKAIELVESNISDPEFSIEQMAEGLGVSRMQLYRKLEALTDMSVKEFIRNLRLKRAAQILSQNVKMNISEIAFSVGFNDLSHFRKCFRQEFGMSASEYVERNVEHK